jgi:hypothetical protein
MEVQVTTLSLEPVIKVLELGWVQGNFDGTIQGKYGHCLIGAAGLAWHGDSSWFVSKGTIEELNLFGQLADFLDVDFDPEGADLSYMIWDGDAFPLSVLSFWNDHVVHSGDEVIAALREFGAKEKEVRGPHFGLRKDTGG